MTEIELHDAIIRHSLDLMRLSAGEQRAVKSILNKLQADLTALLQRRELSDVAKREVEALIDEAGRVIDASYLNAGKSLDTQALAEAVAQKTTKIIDQVLLVTPVAADTIATVFAADIIIQGSPASAWWAKQATDVAFRFAAQVRQGVANGEPNAKIVRRIVGRKGEPGIMDVSRRNAATLVHTAVQAVANTSRLETFRANADVIKGVRQLSTLDSHTSAICIAYSGAAWDLDGKPIEGNKLPFNGGPPRHMNCRSILTPIPKTFRELGLNIDEPVDPGVRASSLGPIAGNTTFEQFLNRQPKSFADQVLGKGRADLWRAGKITLRDLVSGTGRPLTLEQLRAL